jgi:hypothetical protein
MFINKLDGKREGAVHLRNGRGRALVLVEVLTFILLAVMAAPVWAQDTLRLTWFSGPIVIDGRVDEPAWDSIPVLPLTMFGPQYRGEPSQRTEIRVAYDDEYIYVSGRMYVSDPRSVRANTLYRDDFASDDLMSIALDTYNDYQTCAWFCVNPGGGRIDQVLSNDGEPTPGGYFGMPLNLDWNTFWDAETSRNEKGWFAEMRIPFSSLGFQDVNGRVVMGLEVYRYIGSTNERLVYPDIPPSAGGFVKPSLMQRVILEGVHRRTPVYVAPYALGGWERNALPNDAATGFDVTSDYTHEAGLDLRYSPSANLSLDVTVNTDFAQVEADDQQINLTRFPLFFPEKRQFFQERAEILNFGLGGSFSRMFHSRQIGLLEGQPIRLLGGLRLAARMGGADVGVLDMQTASALCQPSENFGVVRLKQQVLNENSTVGGMVTTRLGDDGSYNVAAGVDALVRMFGDEYATLTIARTFESDVSDVSLLDAARIQFEWERRTEGGLSYVAEVIRSGAAFNPGIGFVLRRDFASLEGQLQYLWYAGPSSPFRTLSVEGSALGFRRNADGSIESSTLSPSLSAEFKNGSSLGFTYSANYESVLNSFPISPDVVVLPGEYWFHEGEASYSAPSTNLFQAGIVATVGQFYDGYRVALSATPEWHPSPHLDMGVDYSFNAIRFPDRDLSLDMHLLLLRVRIAYDTHLSLSTFLQYNSVEDLVSMNARLRYNVRDGTDLWIVYNESINTDRYSHTPIPPVSQGRAVMVKYTHTLVW